MSLQTLPGKQRRLYPRSFLPTATELANIACLLLTKNEELGVQGAVEKAFELWETARDFLKTKQEQDR